MTENIYDNSILAEVKLVFSVKLASATTILQKEECLCLQEAHL